MWRASILQRSFQAERCIQLVGRLELLSLSQMPCTRKLQVLQHLDNMDFFIALFYFISFCMNGVNDRKNMKMVASNTRDVIVLHADDAETKRDHVLWMVGAQNLHSPEGYEWIISKLDSYSGLKNITYHTRHHTVWSFSDTGCGEEPQMFNIQSRSSCDPSGKGDEKILVMEGEAVTLHSDFDELKENEIITWWYESPNGLIAQVTKQNLTIVDKTREPRLDFNHGSLTIKNISTTDSGDYQCTDMEKNRCFRIMVYKSLPVPVITEDSSQKSSSSSKCVLLCSVMNVTHVSLSWYKGNSLLSNISVSDLNIRLSLPLEVEYQDTNTYRCVVSNPITNRTQHLNITQHCLPYLGLGPTVDKNSHYGLIAATVAVAAAVGVAVFVCKTLSAVYPSGTKCDLTRMRFQI
ncbi:hypothetical protein E1301_Tti023219 [Triplophysa tibetana]|uniref:Ig-like domain-containing protein n=1 Tax=Triplophysa tibetana TaxID=1572043 RepID=A0A5A9NSJ5_9TELE|nr:hypothetical protein E1301_Tti023219 [Triplophysa tibetana]